MGRIQHIVVPTDFSEPSRAGLRQAIVLAKRDGAALHLMNAVRFPLVGTPYEASVPAAIWEGVRQAAREQIDDAKREVVEAGVENVTTELVEIRNVIAAIQSVVSERNADLVVMGTHGHTGPARALLGSVTERAARLLPCPVLAAKAGSDDDAPPQRILVPVDFSKHSDAASELAIEFAERFGADLTLLHAVDFLPEYTAHPAQRAMEIEVAMMEVGRERLEGLAEQVRAKGINAEMRLVRDVPLNAILEEAERCGIDLIVMGTHGQSGLTHLFLGSVAERTLRHAPCSVLAVKDSADAVPA